MIKRAILLLTLALTSLPAAAQNEATASQPQPTPAQGPMIVEPIRSGWLFAPDAKVTEIDGRTSELIGGSVGRITDDAFFVGGAGYWLTNQSNDREMWYGGLVVQWLARTNARFGYSVKGLVGGGEATLAQTIIPIARGNDARGNDLRGRFDGRVDDGRSIGSFPSVRVRSRQAFFVAEPEVDALIRLTRHTRLIAGAGYRMTVAERGGDSRLRGAVGTLGLQVGGGS